MAARHRFRWLTTARPEQLPPEDGEWNGWLLLAGRGFGKTRTAAEDMAWYALTHPGARIAVIAPTYADARDTCVEGESGLLACLPRDQVAMWKRSLGELVLVNGARFKLFSADKPERLRGPQHHRAWFDELAVFRYREAFDQALMGLRLGERPRWVATTTPRQGGLLRGLMARDDVRVTRGSTFDNARNLAPAALAQLRARYEGTRMGRQELEGELLEDVEGALWKRAWIQRVYGLPYPDNERGLKTTVVGLDPADGLEDGDEQALTVAGLGWDWKLYVLRSEGMRGSTLEYLTHALEVAREVGAARIVVEKNHGGAFLTELLEQAIRQTGIRIAYRVVSASQGKMTRAEPVAMLYEQGKVWHADSFPELEDQLTSWTGGSGEKSPDRLDSLVWAMSDLMGLNIHGPASSDGGAVPYREDPRGVLGAAVAWQ